MNEKKTKERGYSFVCIFYGNHNELIDFLHEHAKHFFFICHNKDEAESHYHIYLTTPIQRSIRTLRSLMHSNSSFLAQFPDDDPLTNRDYFLHCGKPDKHQYPPDDIMYDDLTYWARVFKLKADPVDQNTEFVEDLISNDYSYLYMARKYGRDFIKNYQTYDSFRIELRNEIKRQFTKQW